MEFIGLNKLRRGDMMAIDPMIPHGIDRKAVPSLLAKLVCNALPSGKHTKSY